MIVVDASTLVAVLLARDGMTARRALALDETRFAAPQLIDLEILQAVRRQLHQGVIDEARAAAALSELEALPVDRADHAPLLPLIWALRRNFSAYDAAYVALAQVLEAPLMTRDAKLAQAARTFTKVQLV